MVVDEQPETLISEFEARRSLRDTFSPLYDDRSVWRCPVQKRLKFLQIDSGSFSSSLRGCLHGGRKILAIGRS